MAKRKFLKSLFITLGCALVVGTVGALIYLDRVERVVENKNDSIVDNISFDDASKIFGKENITIGQNGDITISKFQPQTNGDEKFDKIILPSKIDNKNVTYSEDYYKELRNYFKGNGNMFDSSKTSAIKKLFIGDEEGFKHLRLQEAVTNAPSFLRGLEYAEIGKGSLSEKTVVSKYVGLDKNLKALKLQKSIEKYERITNQITETGVIVEGLTNPQIKLAICCEPIPGDEIVGYVSKGSGIVVHRKDCKNVANLEKDRLLDVYWSDNITRRYKATLKIIAMQGLNLITDIMNILSAYNVNVSSLNVKNNNNLETIVRLTLLVSNVSELEKVVQNLNKIETIAEIERDNIWE